MLSTGLSTVQAVILYGCFALAAVNFVGLYAAVTFTFRLSRERRDYRALLLWMQELEDQHEALSASHKRLRSRVGMRELRDKRKENGEDSPEAPSTQSPEEWKREMRAKIHRGEIKL